MFQANSKTTKQKSNLTHHYLTAVLALTALITSPQIKAEDDFTGLGFLLSVSFYNSFASGVSADGSVVVGSSFNAGNKEEAFRWVDGTMTGLGFLPNTVSSFPSGVSADGSVVVGHATDVNNTSEAFRWVDGTMTGLGFLPNTVSSFAGGVSADGSVVVGSSFNANNETEAFRWVDGTMTGLGFLPGVATGQSIASGVSADGSVVVGSSYNANNDWEAFRWVDGTMTALGFLPDAGANLSYAIGVSDDGSVVVGHGYNAYSQTEAFRWVDGTMTALGFLPSFTNSYAMAISADGSVIVGYANDSNYNRKAFRWTLETGMESVEDWLINAGVSLAAWSNLENASGTNSDGSVVVGYGMNANGDAEAFIARVGYYGGVVGLTDLSNSLASQVSPSQTLDTLTGMALNGAHHRPLTDIAMSDGEHCVWASADLGRIHRNGKGWTSLKEVGGCHDFVDNTVRVGVGVGHSRASINQSLGGSSRLHGKYALVEMDWTIPNSALVASVLGMTGRWEADIRRGYAGGTSTSTGDTDMESSSLRARLDWRDAFSLGSVSFSPSMQYTHTSTRIDGYQETGGTSPARFDSQHNKAKESRVALQGAYEYSAKTTLLGRTEWAHRFDSKGASVSGSANILNVTSMPFNVKGNDIEQDWVRVGAEVIHRFSRSNRLSLSTTAASVGQDADFSVGANWTMLF